MLDVNHLRELAQQALRDKELQELSTQTERILDESLEYQEATQRTFEVIFPELTHAIEEIAGKGRSSCGIEFPRDDFAEDLTTLPDVQHLRGVGKLLLEEFRASKLNPLLMLALYDQPPKYGSAKSVLFIEITWGESSEREKYEGPHIANLRHTTPLIRWMGFIDADGPKIEYPVG